MGSWKITYLCIFVGMFSNEILASEKIKVKISPTLKKIQLFSDEKMNVVLPEGTNKKARKLTFNCDFNQKKTFDSNLVASITSSGLVRFNGKSFMGDMDLIARRRSGCELINTIDLENYVSSLLTKEMNKKWPIEALKAQAIAARSYALSKKRKKKTELVPLDDFQLISDDED